MWPSCRPDCTRFPPERNTGEGSGLPVAPPTHDLRLRFALHEPGPDYAVTLQRVADGATLEEATLPSPDFVALEQTRLASLRAYVEQPLPHAFQETVGRELAALLPERIWQEIHAQWMQGLPQSGLRLRLAFDSRCHRLAALPWEYLYLTQEPISGFPGGFFAQQTGFHLWREAPKTVPGETLTTSMLRVLMVCANPGTPAYPSLPHLPAEVETLRAALTAERGRVDLREEGTATPDSLSNQLKQFRPHVVHFIGHGEEQTLGGILILHSGTKGSIAVSGEELASWLQGGELRLVVLSACQTASTRFSGQGVAQMLLTAGVPAVVAMQLPMRDSSGPKLTDELYRTLLRTGSIEEALWQARHRIQDVGPDWGVPTLHIAGNSGALFDFTPALPPGPVYLPAGHNPRFAGRDGVMEEMHQALMDRQNPTCYRVRPEAPAGLSRRHLLVRCAQHGGAAGELCRLRAERFRGLSGHTRPARGHAGPGCASETAAPRTADLRQPERRHGTRPPACGRSLPYPHHDARGLAGSPGVPRIQTAGPGCGHGAGAAAVTGSDL